MPKPSFGNVHLRSNQVSNIEDPRAWEHALIQRNCEKFARVAKQPLEREQVWDATSASPARRCLLWTPTRCPLPTLPDMQPAAMSMETIR